LTVQFISIFPGSPLSPSYKTVRFYDNQNRLQRVLIYASNMDATAFKRSQREDYEYDSASGRINKVLLFVRGSNNDWIPSIIGQYTYTPAGSLIGILEVDATTKEPYRRFVFSQNAALGYQQTEFSYWNPGNGNWNLPLQTTRDYDDAFGRPIAQVQIYNLGPITGADSTRYEYVPNTDCLHKIKQFDGNGSPLTLYRETVHFYGKSVATITPTGNNFKVYPSPASVWLTVEGAEGASALLLPVPRFTIHPSTFYPSQKLAYTESNMLPLGTPAPDFELPEPATGATVRLQSVAANHRATVVMFLCNHCPYVLYVNPEMVRLVSDYKPRGVAFVGISSNDAVTHPEDAPDLMGEHARAVGYDFPYLYDESQSVARAYDAACTPDFYVFDEDLQLTYRGQLDPSRPKRNPIPSTGEDLRAALDAVLEGKPASVVQRPSGGCNIKWRES